MDDSRPSPQPRRNPAPTAVPAATPTPPDDGSDGTTRRWFLVGAGAVVVGAAAGTVAELALHDGATRAPRPAPAELAAAAARERQLIADLDATTGGTPQLRRTLVRARADHAAHLAAFEALLQDYDPARPVSSAAPGPSGTAPSGPHGIARTAAQLRAAETAAATASARAASSASGRLAVLLASVSASESTHAALMS